MQMQGRRDPRVRAMVSCEFPFSIFREDCGLVAVIVAKLENSRNLCVVRNAIPSKPNNMGLDMCLSMTLGSGKSGGHVFLFRSD